MTYFYNLSYQWFSKQFLNFCKSLKASLYTGLSITSTEKKKCISKALTVIQNVTHNNIQSYFIRRQTVLKHPSSQNLPSIETFYISFAPVLLYVLSSVKHTWISARSIILSLLQYIIISLLCTKFCYKWSTINNIKCTPLALYSKK